MMDKVPNSTNMVGQFLGESQGLANQPTYSLAKHAIEALDVSDLPGLFAHCHVALARQDRRIGGPEIRIADGTLPIIRRETIPQFLFGGLTAIADCYTDDLACLTVKREPNPNDLLLAADKRPQFITFEPQASLFLGVIWTVRGTAAYLALT
jgi:hypothetical protein